MVYEEIALGAIYVKYKVIELEALRAHSSAYYCFLKVCQECQLGDIF